MEEQYQNKFKGIDNNMRSLIDWARDRDRKKDTLNGNSNVYLAQLITDYFLY